MSARSPFPAEQRVRSEIEQAFPELKVQDLVFLGAGVDSEAYVINGEWVFRFPKREAVARALGREVALLPRLAGRLPLAIPEFAYLGHQASSGLLFAGYRLIPGEPLTPGLFASLANSQQEQVLATLAAFLVGVHGFPLTEATAVGLEALSTRAWVTDSWSRGRARDLPLLGADDGSQLDRLVQSFLADERNFASGPCLLYADFAPEHVLYDSAIGAITGIIDWGDLAIGDPDFDLLYLHQDYGREFVQRLLRHHSHPEPERLLAKLRVFDVCDHVNTIVDSLQDAPSEPTVQEATEALRALLRQG